jgi:hypothetical protein
MTHSDSEQVEWQIKDCSAEPSAVLSIALLGLTQTITRFPGVSPPSLSLRCWHPWLTKGTAASRLCYKAQVSRRLWITHS